MRRAAFPFLRFLLLTLSLYGCVALAAQPRVLVFSKATGWRHDSIPAAIAALQRLGARQGLAMDHSEDAGDFTVTNLARYRAVVFANTTGEVLDEAQQAALEGFVRRGGGFMGIHSAADTEYDWAWYGELVGAWFQSHPPGLQTTRVTRQDAGGRAIANWNVKDEIYNFRDNPRGRVSVIATVDERDYQGGNMGEDHPIAWCHVFEGGRSWYSGLGHDASIYADENFIRQLRRGLRYAAGLSDEC